MHGGDTAWLAKYNEGRMSPTCGRVQRIWRYSRGYWEAISNPLPGLTADGTKCTTLDTQLTAAGYGIQRELGTDQNYLTIYALHKSSKVAFPEFAVITNVVRGDSNIIFADELPDVLGLLDRFRFMFPMTQEI